MITGAHVLLFSPDAEADRRFLQDAFAFPSVDVGEGWLIFRLPPAELAAHPAAGSFVQRHGEEELLGCVLYLMCDDLEREMGALAARGVVCTPPQDADWGTSTIIRLPSGGSIGLYQPRHASPPAEEAGAAS